MNINIAYIVTESSSYMALISLYSILKNNEKNNFNFYIMHDNEVSSKILNLFETFQKQFSNCESINFIKNHFSTVNVFEVIPYINKDKFLFLNFDSLITTDLSELYSTDLSNNSCAAVEFFHSKDKTYYLSQSNYGSYK